MMKKRLLTGFFAVIMMMSALPVYASPDMERVDVLATEESEITIISLDGRRIDADVYDEILVIIATGDLMPALPLMIEYDLEITITTPVESEKAAVMRTPILNISTNTPFVATGRNTHGGT